LALGSVCGGRTSSLVAPSVTVAAAPRLLFANTLERCVNFPCLCGKGGEVGPDRPRWISHVSTFLCAGVLPTLPYASTARVSSAQATNLLCVLA
jgi:hypothetical protein